MSDLSRRYLDAAAQVLGRNDVSVSGVDAGNIAVHLVDHEVTADEIDQIEAVAATIGPRTDQVDAERDRRINGGFTFNGVAFQSDDEARENIAGASTAALGAMMAGAQPGDLRWHGGDSDFRFIALDNTEVPMDAQTMFAFGQAAMAHKTDHIFAARALKDMDPTPADYTDDQHWPA